MSTKDWLVMSSLSLYEVVCQTHLCDHRGRRSGLKRTAEVRLCRTRGYPDSPKRLPPAAPYISYARSLSMEDPTASLM
jgi:hypothetical protein